MKEKKKAHWEMSFDGYYLTCSNCSYEPEPGKAPEFCPKCGCDMKDELYYNIKKENDN